MRKVRKHLCFELHKGEEHWTGCGRDVGVFFDFERIALLLYTSFLHVGSWICMWHGYMILISCETGENKGWVPELNLGQTHAWFESNSTCTGIQVKPRRLQRASA
jgi:hypothetical protein